MTQSAVVSNVSAKPALPGAWVLIKQSLFHFRQHWVALASLVAFPFVLDLVTLLPGIPVPVIIVVGIISFVLHIALPVAIIYCLAEGVPANVVDLYKRSARLILPVVWAAIISGLATLGGFALLIIPGIFVSV